MLTWLLTSTTYGTWLPGDRRGSVTSVRDLRPSDGSSLVRVEHDRAGDPYEGAIPELEASARDRMSGPPVLLTSAQAGVIVGQFRETALFRRWDLLAASVMVNHFHLVVRAAGDVQSEKLLGDFKSYASRALSQRFGKPASETWWTKSGSRRKLPDERAVFAAVRYVTERQPNPLAVWVCEEVGAIPMSEPAPSWVGVPDAPNAPTPDGAGSAATPEPAPSGVGALRTL